MEKVKFAIKFLIALIYIITTIIGTLLYMVLTIPLALSYLLTWHPHTAFECLLNWQSMSCNLGDYKIIEKIIDKLKRRKQ